MRKHFQAWSAALLIATVWVAASVEMAGAADSQPAGAWVGTWQGDADSGRFDMTLAQEGNWSGGVSVGQTSGDYTAKFTTVTVTGNKLTAKYDFPPDPQAEIVLSGTVEGNKASGTWTLQPKGQEMAVATGTWTITKK